MAVTAEQVAREAGYPLPLSDYAQARIQQWIDDATLALRNRARREGVDLVSLDPDTMDYVVRIAAARHAARPDAARQVSTSVDDGSVSRTYSESAGRVTIGDDLWGEFGVEGATERSAFTAETYRPRRGFGWDNE